MRALFFTLVLRLEMFSLTPGVLRMTGSTAALDRSRVALPDFGVDATGDVRGCECQSFAIKIEPTLLPARCPSLLKIVDLLGGGDTESNER
jgi:hypothetical protein